MNRRGGKRLGWLARADLSDALNGFSRREFLRTTAFAAVAAMTTLHLPAGPSDSELRETALIDTNIDLSRWPFRRLPLDETPALVEKLHNHGVRHAWAGSFDGLLHKDLAAVNTRLTEECRKYGRGVLQPFGSINPKLPGWEAELQRCKGEHKMAGVRLHPNYHGYRLDDPQFAKCLAIAAEIGLAVQLAVSMEDERMQHPLLQIPHVDVAPLSGALKSLAQLPLILLNWFRAVKAEQLPALARAGNVFFDTATVEGVGGLGTLLKQVPPSRVLFGSHAPFFYFEAALLKLKESPLSREEQVAIRFGNAGALLQLSRPRQ